MATPQETIVTFSGRRCTRSRARTAATSSIAEAEPSPTQASLATTTDAQRVETSAAPPSPEGSTEDEIEIEPISTPPANVVSSPPAPVATNPSAIEDEPDGATEIVSTTSLSTISTSAVLPITTPFSPSTGATFISSILSNSTQSRLPIEPPVEATPGQPQQSDGESFPTSTGVPAAGSDGMIGSDESVDSAGPSLTISERNVGGIVGGVVGGFAGVVLISVLLFLCLKRRRTREPFARWQQRLNEKGEGDRGLLARLKTFSTALKNIPAGFGVMVGKLRGRQAGPVQNPYARHSVRSSVSSVYSTRSNRRSHSISEPPSRFKQHLHGFGGKFSDRMPSLRKTRQDSLVAGAKSPFPGIVEDPVVKNSKGVNDLFSDPEALDPPRTLQLHNPDPHSREGTLNLEKTENGMKNQQRPLATPERATLPGRGSHDPFASFLDELEERRGSGTPDWLQNTAHKRTHSAATALRSHPPSPYTASVYTTAGDERFPSFSTALPVPNQPLPPNPPPKAASTYTSDLPTFTMTSSAASRESNTSFFFGEPGPSRPTTNLFSELSIVSAAPRGIGRQSDPFDLDRPEVLSFGHAGSRQVRASVTRQNSKNRRISSVPNWLSLENGPYERTSAVPGPLRNPSVKRDKEVKVIK